MFKLDCRRRLPAMNFSICVIFLFCCVIPARNVNASECNSRTYDGPNNIVCVCNSSYCDTILPLPNNLPDGMAALYVSSQSGKRFSYEVVSGMDLQAMTGDAADSGTVIITVDPSSRKQSIIGFGGAFTDAAGINIASLSDNTQAQLIKSYFGQDGLEYTMGRVPMASCDFSPREYSYDDVPDDFDLTNFALAEEDLRYKIPYIKAAMSASGGTIKLYGTPWSAPGWMKTTGRMKGNGTLIGSAGDKYHKTWANYFVKFIQEYATNNISIWGIAVQNEPRAGFQPEFRHQAMGFTPEMERDFVKIDLGPTLAANNLANIKLMILDDQRHCIPEWADTILGDPLAAKYVSGIAVHWYSGIQSMESLDYAHKHYPEYFILASEACNGALPDEVKGPVLGDWTRAEKYARDIIEDINHWAGGWVDWNLALDVKGGPNWVGNVVDAPVIVNKTADEFYKQPMFYALGHFSKFVRPDSVRIESTVSPLGASDDNKLDVVAFVRPDDRRVVVVLNRNDDSRSVVLKDEVSTKQFKFSMDARSVATIVWSA